MSRASRQNTGGHAERVIVKIVRASEVNSRSFLIRWKRTRVSKINVLTENNRLLISLFKIILGNRNSKLYFKRIENVKGGIELNKGLVEQI